MGSYKGTFTANLTTQLNNTFGAGGTVQSFRYNTIITNDCDILEKSIHKISAGLSAQQIAITPFASNIGSATLLELVTNQPIDLRLGEASNTPISNTRYIVMNANLSGVFITTGSLTTTVMMTIWGGSAATFNITPPLPV